MSFCAGVRHRASNKLKLVRVIFSLTDDYPEANLRHYTFMLEGLRETQAALVKCGISMAMQQARLHAHTFSRVL